MVMDDENNPKGFVIGWEGDCKRILHDLYDIFNATSWWKRRKELRNALSFLRSWGTDKPHAMIEAMFLSHEDFVKKADQIEPKNKSPEDE